MGELCREPVRRGVPYPSSLWAPSTRSGAPSLTASAMLDLAALDRISDAVLSAHFFSSKKRCRPLCGRRRQRACPRRLGPVRAADGDPPVDLALRLACALQRSPRRAHRHLCAVLLHSARVLPGRCSPGYWHPQGRGFSHSPCPDSPFSAAPRVASSHPPLLCRAARYSSPCFGLVLLHGYCVCLMCVIDCLCASCLAA